MSVPLIRPICSTPGCTNLVKLRPQRRKDGTPYYHTVCNTHYRERYGMEQAEYDIWRMMIKRCADPDDKHYHNYGGRGISVCRRWRASYRHFLADMGPRPSKGYSIERQDNDGNYEPGNCSWSTKREQDRNKRTNHWLTFNGQTLIITDWARLVGVRANVISARLKKGWSVERALTTPLLSRPG